MDTLPPYDALLVISFGGPEGPADVMPFLENVLRGRNVPRERMLEVAEHYQHFGGVSPINAQCRELIAALRLELDARGIALPLYWGNRNWHPLLPDTLAQIKADGNSRVLAYVTSAYSSYSGCRQYREDVIRAQGVVGEGAPSVEKIRAFYNHPRFIAANVARLRTALDTLAPEQQPEVHVAFTAHSIPLSMSRQSDYEKQLLETCRLVADQLGLSPDHWRLVYQSRSGRPEDPWLEPDICDHLRSLHEDGAQHVIISPIGFLSDHMEVLYDLDEEARNVCQELGLNMVRAETVGTHPEFVGMIADLIVERLTGTSERPAIGQYGPNHDVCPLDCCPAPVRPTRPVS